MYYNWLFLTNLLFPPKKKRKEEKGNKVVKPVLNHFFQDPIDFHSKEEWLILSKNNI